MVCRCVSHRSVVAGRQSGGLAFRWPGFYSCRPRYIFSRVDLADSGTNIPTSSPPVCKSERLVRLASCVPPGSPKLRDAGSRPARCGAPYPGNVCRDSAVGLGGIPSFDLHVRPMNLVPVKCDERTSMHLRVGPGECRTPGGSTCHRRRIARRVV